LPIQTLTCWIVLLASYFIGSPAENINWVYGLGSSPQKLLAPPVYLFLLMTAIPLVVYIPTHFAMRWFLPRS
jgi:hypothetical protein